MAWKRFFSEEYSLSAALVMVFPSVLEPMVVKYSWGIVAYLPQNQIS